MVFKRREKRPWWQAVLRFLWPQGGWGRAARYVQHRIRRLPDSPEKIARGVWAGVFMAWTPFYGLHFLLALLLARLMRGNMVAALLGTFFGNPLTYVPIGVISLQTGYYLLGQRPPRRGVDGEGVLRRFGQASADLWHNFKAMFTSARADWDHLAAFYDDVFFPYLVGGILPGIVSATACYYLTVPVVSAYQNRRRKILARKLDRLKDGAEGDGQSN